jgi:hypothetical protein
MKNIKDYLNMIEHRRMFGDNMVRYRLAIYIQYSYRQQRPLCGFKCLFLSLYCMLFSLMSLNTTQAMCTRYNIM